MQTNGIERSCEPMSLEQLGKLIVKHARDPLGVIVSCEIMDELTLRTSPGADPSFLFGGIKVIVDPKMPATEFEVAFTAEAWRKRMKELSRPA